MARSACCPWHRRKQTFPRSRSVADRNLRAALSAVTGWSNVETLLRDGIGRNRDRSFDRGDSSGRTCLAYAHAKPDGISKQVARATNPREAIFASRRRSSGQGGDGAGYSTQIVRGNQHISVAAETARFEQAVAQTRYARLLQAPDREEGSRFQNAKRKPDRTIPKSSRFPVRTFQSKSLITPKLGVIRTSKPPPNWPIPSVSW